VLRLLNMCAVSALLRLLLLPPPPPPPPPRPQRSTLVVAPRPERSTEQGSGFTLISFKKMVSLDATTDSVPSRAARVVSEREE
jgi:hypothetical protein